MPNEPKNNVVPMKGRRPKAERLNQTDHLVLALVRQHIDPAEAYDFDRPPREGAVEASLAKLERLGHVKRATGYVATARGPRVVPELDAEGSRVLHPHALANEFCVPAEAVAGILERVGLPPGVRVVIREVG